MSKTQLSALFICNTVLFTVGNGPISLLPVYATRLGADPAQAGYILASFFLAVTIGTIGAGWLSDRVQRRKLLLIISGLIQVPTFCLLGQANSLGPLVLLTFVSGFLAGIAITMGSILTALFAEEADRGRVFGIIASSVGLGGLIGGLTSGPIADRWGYPALFTLSGLFLILHPLVGLLLEDKVIAETRPASTTTVKRPIRSRTFLLLFFASIIAFMANSVHILSRPLMMDKLGFDATAISSTVAVSGLIILPIPLLVGWLSDRVGRKPLLIVCYIANTIALFILLTSVDLWQFWLSTALQALLFASIGVGSALVTDIVPQESLGTALALFTGTNWIGLVIGLIATGTAIDGLGMSSTLIMGISFALVAIVLVFPIRSSAAETAVTTG